MRRTSRGVAGWPATVSPSQDARCGRAGPGLPLVTVPPLLLTIEAASRLSTWSMVTAVLHLPSITLAWLWLFFGTNGGRMSRRHLMRWLVIPAILVLTVLVVGSDIPFLVRFALSRPELDRVAADVMAGGSTDRTSIGLFPVEYVERTSDGMVFSISGSGLLGSSSIEYAPNGPPADAEDFGGVELLGDGWWMWAEAD